MRPNASGSDAGSENDLCDFALSCSAAEQQGFHMDRASLASRMGSHLCRTTSRNETGINFCGLPCHRLVREKSVPVSLERLTYLSPDHRPRRPMQIPVTSRQGLPCCAPALALSPPFPPKKAEQRRAWRQRAASQAQSAVDPQPGLGRNVKNRPVGRPPTLRYSFIWPMNCKSSSVIRLSPSARKVSFESRGRSFNSAISALVAVWFFRASW